jgi:exonuclease SbcC
VVGKFSTKLVQLADRTRQVNDSKLNTEKLNKKLEGWNKKQREQQAVSEQLKPQHDTRDKKRVMLNDLELWAQVKELQGSISKEEKGEKKRSEHIEKRGEELKAEISILAGLKEQFETQKKAMPDLELLQRLRIWFGRAKELTQQISQEKKDVLENQKEVVQHLDGFAPADWIVAESTLDKKNDSEKIWGEKLESLSGKLAAEMEVIKEEGAILRVQQKLGEHAAAMVEGEPCKLCGSLEHPAIFDEGSVAEELRLKTAQWQKVSERSKALQKQRNALDGILPLLADKRSKIELSQPELKKLDEQEKANLEAFTFEGLSPQDGEKVAQMDKDSVHQLKVLNTAQAKVETQQQVVDKGNQSLRDEVKAHTEASASIKIAEERSRTLQTQIKQVEVAAVESSTAAQLRADFITETEALATLEKDFTALQKDINETKQILDAKTGELSANLQRMKESEEDRGVLELEINKLVKASEFQTLEEVKKVLKISLNVAEEREVINIFNRTMHTAKASVEALQKAIGEKPFDEESYRKLKLELSEKVTARATEHDNLVKEQQKLRGLETDWKKHQEIDKELEKLHLRETNLSTLSSLFHHEGFLDYIASVYLQQLCNAANARFRSLTQQRLVLEIDDNNEFRVIDALNGGKARSVKTLSGGQMFQASLSLALALSESIQAFAGTEQNFFFLDEGFGTQDKESLRLVFESLKELRKENRVVGLISHVDELQEEIDVCLKVRNDDEIGSLVELVG